MIALQILVGIVLGGFLAVLAAGILALVFACLLDIARTVKAGWRGEL